ncbi:MAG: ferrous iron transport protein A [Clostridiales bacterium]|nr:ferrous iron transport protein A [Clostridiales bacterium]
MSNNFANQNSNLSNSTTLDKIPVGTACTIVSCSLPEPLNNRLKEMGLTPNTTVTVLKTAPLGDPMEIQARGYSLCLRRETLRGFVVKPTEPFGNI